ncbi:GNAT family N-acetyltransferase [Limibacter armeniacum]|uniref:GNAT family N-acetyltransferase n=1 Tax=Limibacter armeniacum TaxID=466084 RepID=UPI002FE5C3A0
MEINFEKGVLREWRNEDIPALLKYANNPKIFNNVRDRFPHPYTLDDAEVWIKLANLADPLENFAIVVDGEAIGSIGIMKMTDVYRLNLEIGYFIGEPYWGKGIVTQAVKAMVDYAFETFEVVRIFAGVFEHNKASMRVLEKVGFQLEAIHRKAVIKNGKLMDEYLYVYHKKSLAE